MGRASPHARFARGLLLGLAWLAGAPSSAQSQGLVVRDGTLGSGPLEVGPALDGSATYLITPEMGEQRGSNLFHSFWRFGIGQGETATFTGPEAIDDLHPSVSHVISRVTGGDPSQIDGRLRSTIPGASVWLFNPNGVGFGEGAEIDVRGSFHAGTADYVALGESGLERFYRDATRPSVLATAPPAAFGFLPESHAASLVIDRSQLAVDPGETLELVAAGDLSLTGAELVAPGGHVGLEAQGQVALSQSLVDVGGLVPGSISIRGGQIVIEEGSRVLAENEGTGPGGRIDVAASELVLVDDSLLSVNTWSAGDAGTIHVTGLGEGRPSPDVTLQNGPGVSPNINLDAPHATVVGASAETSSSGAGGTIDVHARALTLTDGAGLSATTFGSAASGNAGTIDIAAASVDVSRGSAITAQAWRSPGNAGNVRVEAGSLVLREGGFIRTSVSSGMRGTAGGVSVIADRVVIGSVGDGPARGEARMGPGGTGDRVAAGIFAVSFGTGTAGSVEIVASESITLDDFRGDRFDFGRVLDLIFAATGVITSTAFGMGGPIKLDAPTITVTRGALVASSTIGGGAAGDILLKGDRILIERGAFVDSSTAVAPGAAGNLLLDAEEWIKVVGQHEDFGYASTVSSGTLGPGRGGAVTLRAPLLVVDGGVVSTAAVPIVLPFPTDPRVGAGGDITLEGVGGAPAREILVQGGGRVVASTLGSEVGGQILAVASESIRVEGLDSGIESRTGADGAGGGVTLRAPRIEVASGGEVSARSASFVDERGEPDFDDKLFGRSRPFLRKPPPTAKGNAGSITLAATRLVHLDAGEITTSVGVATGGNIAIDPVFVILENGSRILATADTGHGGFIRITTDNFFAFPGNVVSADSKNQQLSGTVEIHSPDVDLAGTLTPLPSAFLDAAALMQERCAARRSGERAGSFSVRGPGGIPAEPDGWLRAPVVLADATATAAGAPGPPALVASLPASLLAHRACP